MVSSLSQCFQMKSVVNESRALYPLYKLVQINLTDG